MKIFDARKGLPAVEPVSDTLETAVLGALAVCAALLVLWGAL